jgi:hypothetical protein
MLMGTYGFKLKGTGPIDYHLGMSFTQNEHGQLCISPKRYIGKMVDLYKQMFRENPPSKAKAKSPLDSNDHPKTDMTEFFGEEGIQMYQLLIVSIQWAITILHTAVSFSVLVCLSILTMSFLAPCADSACPPSMLTCHAVLLSLFKKNGKVFATYSQDFLRRGLHH